MANPTFPLRNEMDRQRAIACLQKIDLGAGYVWTMREEVRSDAQNRRMWAMLRDISRQVEWYGQKLEDADWKHVFSAAVEQQRAVPGLNGGFVMPDEERDLSLGEPDSRIHYAAPGPERANFRSATPKGFARAVFEANAPHLRRQLHLWEAA